MEWIVEFDFMEEGFRHWWFALVFLLVFGLVGLVVIRYRMQIASVRPLSSLVETLSGQQLTPKIVKFFGQMLLGAAVISCVIAFLFTYRQYSTLAQAYEDQSYSELEGVITDFVPAKLCVSGRAITFVNGVRQVDGPTVERFSLNGAEFAYSNYYFEGGFDKIVPCGGPLQEGMGVRLWHVEGIIIRLEIRQ